ncbi:MAG TPA: PAS domain S-box protein [Caulobacteraceae bacterium]
MSLGLALLRGCKWKSLPVLLERRRPPLNLEALALIADSVICTDEDGRILVFNQAAEESFGYSAIEVIGQPVEMLLPQGHRAEHVLHVQEFASGMGTAHRLMGQRREVLGRRKNGEEFPAEAMVSRQRIDGRTILTVVHRDITERKQVEDLREAVAQERDHRMNNLLSVVNSLISLSAAGALNVEEFRASLVGRLRALAATQGVLRFQDQSDTNLSDLFTAELDQYRSPAGTNLTIEGPAVTVGPRAAQILALAVHELATNAAKYGSLGSIGGHVTLTSAYKGEGGGQVVIEWRETGGPRVRPPKRRGFGTDFIQNVAGRALRADVAMDYQPGGLVCRMTLPRATLEAGVPARG